MIQVTRDGGYEAFEALDGSTVYYIKDRDTAGLWSVPPFGGEESLVIPSARNSFWAVADHGIYYLDRAQRMVGNELKLYQHQTRRSTALGHITSAKIWGGLTVTRDGKSILWSQLDRDDTSLMMIENFR